MTDREIELLLIKKASKLAFKMVDHSDEPVRLLATLTLALVHLLADEDT